MCSYVQINIYHFQSLGGTLQGKALDICQLILQNLYEKEIKKNIEIGLHKLHSELRYIGEA